MTLSLALAVVAITGFISLSYEILWFRAISFVTGSSPAVFGLLLGFYLGGLAVGSFGSGIFCQNLAAHGNRKYLRHIAGFVLLANLVGFLVLPLLAWVTTRAGWDPALGLIALSSAMLGAVLPLVSHLGIAPDLLAGTRLSYLYAANIVGSVLGSFVTGFVLLEVMPIQHIAALLMVIGCVRWSPSWHWPGFGEPWRESPACRHSAGGAAAATPSCSSNSTKSSSGPSGSLRRRDSRTWWKTAVESSR